MDTTTRNRRLSPRARRALPLIAAAVLVTTWASVAYLQPSLLRLPEQVSSRAEGPVALPNDYQAAYSFLSPSLGWALVAERTSATPRFSVFRTIDAARHWKRQFSRQLNAISLAPLHLQFFDSSHGLIALGDPTELYRTSDGGAHWTLVRTPDYFYSTLVSADANHAWVLGWSESSSQPVPRLFSTADGGSTWTALGPVPPLTFNGKGGYANSFAFRSPTEGWFGSLAAEPTVYYSTDGGASWQLRLLPASCTAGDLPAGARPLFTTEVNLLPDHGIVAFASGGCGNNEGYTSFDGGISWQSVASAPGSTSYTDFAYQDWTHWWAMRYGALWKSADAGRSWKLVSQQTEGWDYVPHIIDAEHAWAEVFGPPPGHSGVGLAVTSDGGLHWTQVSAPKPV